MAQKKTKRTSTAKKTGKTTAKKKPSRTSPLAVNARSLNKDMRGRLIAIIKYSLPRLVVVCLIALLGYSAYLDISIRKKFEGQKWALPAHVYTRPMELYLGQKLDRAQVEEELLELGYQARNDVQRVGSYQFEVARLSIHQREFQFWDGLRAQQRIHIKLADNRINEIRIEDDAGESQDTEIVRLEPRLFGSVSPLSHEDRTLLKLEQVPTDLVNALIASEDRQFYSHFGINPLGIMRAMIRNVRAGRVVQGGSTLTQQLVKNYYLNSDQTYKRKLNEMIMAILLEMHYSKQEILEAYINEVYLSQAGNRAIHGFDLASRYFFGQPLQELDLAQIALLAAINNGPSYYNPVRNPTRAEERRNLVLQTMLDEQLIDQNQFDQASSEPLRVSLTAVRAAPLSYPAFMGFIRENLKDDYLQEDLANAGLQIHTTLNPRIQRELEQATQKELQAIEKAKNLPTNSLQVAAVVIRTDNGEVAAMVGDRKARFSGFNRAIKARRPVGSLLKPFVYLTALERPEQYSLASPINDQKIVVSQRGSADWRPQNYDGQEHGSVMLIDALARSYNLATVQLGMAVGVDQVANTIRRVGYHETFSELPSVLLGAVPMTVMDVGQLYLTLASGGFKTPIKGIRAVLSNEHQPLARYPLTVDQVVAPEFNSLITYALQEVVRNGTARVVLNGFTHDYGLAGKTGTTDDYRDSWFAGFSGNYLTVVWVGRDDNESTGLTGASGAAKIWSRVMRNIPQQRLEIGFHENLIAQRIVYSLDPEIEDCSLTRQLPVLLASLPLEQLQCAERMQYHFGDEQELQHFEPRPQDQPAGKDKPKRKSFWERIFG